MKTLDEVIKGFECCLNIECDKCPYKILFNDDTHVPCDQIEKDEDALFYLKEYQTLQFGYIKAMADLDDNPPLTWDELKTMKGKPVWVVEEGYQTWEYWSLVYWMNADELTLLNENGQTTYSKNEQGTVWQAYRKERK